MVSIGYLALTRAPDNARHRTTGAGFALVSLLPLGGLAREGRPDILDDVDPAASSPNGRRRGSAERAWRRWPAERLGFYFGVNGRGLGRGTRARPLRAAL